MPSIAPFDSARTRIISQTAGRKDGYPERRIGGVVSSVTYLLLPHYGPIVSKFMMIVEGLGEVPIVFLLLVRGVTVPLPGEPA